MNSKLRDILEELHNCWLEDDFDPTDPHAIEAEKAIRQAVGEEMLEMVGDEEDDRLKFSPEWRAGNNAKLYELRQKIKQWQGGEDA